MHPGAAVSDVRLQLRDPRSRFSYPDLFGAFLIRLPRRECAKAESMRPQKIVKQNVLTRLGALH
jgi:hypothetical protein